MIVFNLKTIIQTNNHHWSSNENPIITKGYVYNIIFVYGFYLGNDVTETRKLHIHNWP